MVSRIEPAKWICSCLPPHWPFVPAAVQLRASFVDVPLFGVAVAGCTAAFAPSANVPSTQITRIEANIYEYVVVRSWCYSTEIEFVQKAQSFAKCIRIAKMA